MSENENFSGSTDSIIDSILDEHNTDKTNEAQEGGVEDVIDVDKSQDDKNIEDDDRQENEEEQEDSIDDNQEDDVVFPKKAKRALARRIKKIKKQSMLLNEREVRIAELEQKLESYKGADNKSEELKSPQESDFDNFEDYDNANIEYRVQEAVKKLNQGQESQQHQHNEDLTPQEEFKLQKADDVYNNAQETAKNVPDFQSVVDENADILDDISPELEQTFMALENPSMAFYNLAKSGKLESLNDMPIQMATIEMMNAQNIPYKQPAKVSSAPKPMKASKGSGRGIKSLNDMSPSELDAWRRS